MINYQGILIKNHESVPQPSIDTYFLLENLNIKRTDEILEIGTGAGLVTVYCAQRTRNVVATDISEKSLRCSLANIIANRTYNTQLKKGELFESVENEKFDLIIFNLSQLLATSTDLNPEKLLTGFTKKVRDYLKPEGRFQVLVPGILASEDTVSTIEQNNFMVDLIPHDKSPTGDYIIKVDLKGDS